MIVALSCSPLRARRDRRRRRLSWRRARRSGRAADALVPEYELTVSNGARLKKLFRENAWMKEFPASNLYRGSMVRLGPVLYAAGARGRTRGRAASSTSWPNDSSTSAPCSLSYFHAPGLVSPFGVTLPGADAPRTRAPCSLVVKGLRSGDRTSRRRSARRGRRGRDVAVTPLALRLQRFAAVETPDVPRVSRDPRVAASSRAAATRTRASRRPSLDVETRRVLLGMVRRSREASSASSDRLRVTFDWDRKKRALHARRRRAAAREGPLLGTGPSIRRSSARFRRTRSFSRRSSCPIPGALTRRVRRDVLPDRAGKERRARRARVAPYLGMTTGEQDRTAPGALGPPRAAAEGGRPRVAGPRRPLQPDGSYKVPRLARVSRIVALSPSKAALERIAEACAGRTAVLPAGAAEDRRGVHGQPVSTAAFLNVGRVPEVRASLGLAARDAAAAERRGADGAGRRLRRRSSRRDAAPRPPSDVRLLGPRGGRRGRHDRESSRETRAHLPCLRRLSASSSFLAAAPLLAKEHDDHGAARLRPRRDARGGAALHALGAVHGARLPPEGHEGVRDEPGGPEARVARAGRGVEQREVPLLGPQQDAPRTSTGCATAADFQLRTRLKEDFGGGSGLSPSPRASPRARRRSSRARRVRPRQGVLVRAGRRRREEPFDVPGFDWWFSREGRFRQKVVPLPKLAPGFYLVQVLQGDLEGQVVLVVNDLSAVLQQTDGAALVRSRGATAARPPGADRRREEPARRVGRGGQDGRRRRASDPERQGHASSSPSSGRRTRPRSWTRSSSRRRRYFPTSTSTRTVRSTRRARRCASAASCASRARGLRGSSRSGRAGPRSHASRSWTSPARTVVKEIDAPVDGRSGRSPASSSSTARTSTASTASPRGSRAPRHAGEFRVREYVKPLFFFKVDAAEETLRAGGDADGEGGSRALRGRRAARREGLRTARPRRPEAPQWIEDAGLGETGSATTYGWDSRRPGRSPCRSPSRTSTTSSSTRRARRRSPEAAGEAAGPAELRLLASSSASSAGTRTATSPRSRSRSRTRGARSSRSRGRPPCTRARRSPRRLSIRAILPVRKERTERRRGRSPDAHAVQAGARHEEIALHDGRGRPVRGPDSRRTLRAASTRS